MKAIRRFNNNVVLCVDDKGQEVVVFGKGVGFHELPYEVELSMIEKSYYGIENRYMEMINSLSSDSLDISRKALDLCRSILVGEINPNLLFTLADHIDFTIERYRKGLRVNMPLYYDFENLHPLEFQISQRVLKMIEEKFRIHLPKDEAVGIGMSILNSEYDSIANQPNNDTQEIIEEITGIIEREFSITIDRESGNYARYISHMQYLMERVNSKKINVSSNTKLYETLKNDYPIASGCADKISDYLIRRKQYKLNQDELLYLIIHINRLCSREECYQ